MNGAALVLPEGEKVMAVDRLASLIKRQQITVFFVTTALFNTLVDFQLDCFRDIRNVLFGGERISVEHSRKALEYMGKGRIIHVYGPTETTVYATYYFIDTIADNAVTIPIGKPISNTGVYLLDKNLKPVPIGVSGEVYISGKGTARGYLNRPELTAEKFLSASYRSYRTYISKKIYKTGDLARWLPDGNIEFIGRIDHQVKLRGFRIELGEIESRLVNHDGIKEAVVLLKEDKQGSRGYLCAYYVSSSGVSLAVSELREYLSKGLPHYMIPSYFVQIDEIPLTSNGKVDRRKLPEPVVASADRYEAPGNEIEEKLVEIWAEVLNIDGTSIGVNDNFFELGGHSLKATVVMSMIRRVFNVPLALSELFKGPFIRQLSRTIAEAVTEQYISVEAVEKKDYYVLSSAQKRLYILQQTDEADMTYNMPLVRVLEGKLDKERLATAFRRLIARHESFRTSFGMVHGEPVQKIHREVSFEIEWGEKSSFLKDLIRPFALSQAPLLRVGLVKLESEKHLLIIDMHHIISDGTSMKIFINDFTALYAHPGKELPPLRLQYKDFSRWQNSKKGKEILKAQEKYWLAQFMDEVPELELNYDYLIPVKRDPGGNRYDFELTPEKTELIKQLAQEEGVTLFMFLLAIYVVLLHKLSWSEDIVVGTPVMAREHAELHSIIGMFVNTLAIRNCPSGDKPFKDFLKEVKQRTLQAFENQAYPFDELVEKIRVKVNEQVELVNTMFALQNIELPQADIPGLVLKPYDYKHPVARF
ncbi:MAG: AMP-binding protein, partial [Candidatus Aminicenantes bacterium]|nr:AMP-binding protein [Candidatus Aminicenantes bacterium]NIN20836.1 AMP-binding protein [Candidatus Aminicenantes bacterium]NIN45219.1 AMP-binding protein [Candidatus Aminicenantes bacterium]NIN88036.1 AMP-binding protein [Candidatus Aminicenantes bacterium]NIO83753.1 AMP-binding protein [Candidatus Aminicenantes bacterium]